MASCFFFSLLKRWSQPHTCTSEMWLVAKKQKREIDQLGVSAATSLSWASSHQPRTDDLLHWALPQVSQAPEKREMYVLIDVGNEMTLSWYSPIIVESYNVVKQLIASPWVCSHLVFQSWVSVLLALCRSFECHLWFFYTKFSTLVCVPWYKSMLLAQ